MEVKASYLTAELVRLEFGNCHLVSDHPVELGGGGKGPSPGVMMLSALTACGVLAARRRAERQGIALKAVRAAATARYDREPVDGPMSAFVTTGLVRQRLDLAGGPFEAMEDLRNAMENCAVARTLKDGLELDEQVLRRPSTRPRALVGERNEALWAREIEALGLPKGQSIPGPLIPRWGAIATAGDSQGTMVDLSRNLLPVSDRAGGPEGPSPGELLAAALAACTAIFVARNARFRGIPVEAVDVSVQVDPTLDQDRQIRRMSKTAVITGDLTDAEFEQCKYFADYCAIGNSLKRGMVIETDAGVTLVNDAKGPGERAALVDLAPPTDTDCVDGTCCVP